MWTTGWRWNISPITIQGRKDSVLQCCLVSFNIILYVTGGQDDTIRIKWYQMNGWPDSYNSKKLSISLHIYTLTGKRRLIQSILESIFVHLFKMCKGDGILLRNLLLNENHPLHNWTLHISGTFKEPEKANIEDVFTAKGTTHIQILREALNSQAAFGRPNV